jgi:hypothetical protein
METVNYTYDDLITAFSAYVAAVNANDDEAQEVAYNHWMTVRRSLGLPPPRLATTARVPRSSAVMEPYMHSHPRNGYGW